MPGGKTKNTRRLGTLNTSKKKNINIEVSELEERYHEIVDIIKKTPPKRETKYMTQEITQKNKSKKIKPQQQKMKARLQKPKHKGPTEKA